MQYQQQGMLALALTCVRVRVCLLCHAVLCAVSCPVLQGDALQQQLSAALATEADLRKELEDAVAEAAKLRVRMCMCLSLSSSSCTRCVHVCCNIWVCVLLLRLPVTLPHPVQPPSTPSTRLHFPLSAVHPSLTNHHPTPTQPTHQPHKHRVMCRV